MRIDKRSRGRASLEGRIEGNLRIIFVEDILRPKLNAPCLIRTAQTDTRIEYGETILFLLREQVGTGVVIAGHAAIDIDKPCHAIAADIGRPGDAGGCHQFGRVRQIVAGQFAQR